MTKKVFIALAQIIKYHIADDTERSNFVRILLPILYNANPRFDGDKFCKACGLSSLKDVVK